MRAPAPQALHRSDRPSATAQWTTLGRALELRRPAAQRIVSDPFAPLFLSAAGRRVLAPVGVPAVARAVRTAERHRLASIATSALCRHGVLDEHLLAALPDVEQVLVLGAGWDARAHRFADAIGDRTVVEVDLPPLSRRKRQVVAASPDVFVRPPVASVEIDFRTQSLTERLADSPFRAGAPTVVVWEGVTMYLTRDAVLATLRALAGLCGPGSTLGVDLWRPVDGRRAYDLVRRAGVRGLGLLGEPIGFALPPREAGSLLASAGWTVADLSDGAAMTARLATDGRRCDDGLYVVAAVTG